MAGQAGSSIYPIGGFVGAFCLASREMWGRNLLIGQETYQNDLLGKPRSFKHSSLNSKIFMRLDEMIRTIIKAGYEVRKTDASKAVKAADLLI
jgi:hypothetical protein